MSILYPLHTLLFALLNILFTFHTLHFALWYLHFNDFILYIYAFHAQGPIYLFYTPPSNVKVLHCDSTINMYLYAYCVHGIASVYKED